METPLLTFSLEVLGLLRGVVSRGFTITMSLKSKFKEWYLKPRGGKLMDFSMWVLTDNKAMGILLIMGHIVSFLLFSTLLVVGFWLNWGILGKAILAGGVLLTARNLYRYIKYQRKDEMITNMSMDNMLYGGKHNEYINWTNTESNEERTGLNTGTHKEPDRTEQSDNRETKLDNESNTKISRP